MKTLGMLTFLAMALALCRGDPTGGAKAVTTEMKKFYSGIGYGPLMHRGLIGLDGGIGMGMGMGMGDGMGMYGLQKTVNYLPGYGAYLPYGPGIGGYKNPVLLYNMMYR